MRGYYVRTNSEPMKSLKKEGDDERIKAALAKARGAASPSAAEVVKATVVDPAYDF